MVCDNEGLSREARGKIDLSINPENCTIVYSKVEATRKQVLQCTFVESGRYYNECNYYYSAYTPAFARLLLFTKGTIRFINGEISVYLSLNRLYLIPAHHSFDIEYERDTELFFFHFTVEDTLGRDPFCNIDTYLELDDPLLFSWVIQAYTRERTWETGFWETVAFSAICEFVKTVPLTRVDQNELTNLRNLIQYINECANPKMSVAELAQMSGVSRYALTRAFKRACGLSPKQYIVMVLMQKARSLLLSTEMSIQEIATAIGYDDVCYFSRIFKSHVGGSPLGFRQAARDEARQLRS